MSRLRLVALILTAVLLSGGCGNPSTVTTPGQLELAPSSIPQPAAIRLAAVLDAQPDRVKARYRYRHPQETLEFFGLQPGMTVIEALPGAGWYSKILLPYLGEDGTLIGADYDLAMWAKFDFMTPKALEKKSTWPADWTERARGWRKPGDARVEAFALGSLPDARVGTVDAVLFVRALHNMARFENDGGFLSAAINDAYRALRPGGVAGVVQHRAPDQMPDEWAAGANGYLKRAFVIAQMENAGFQFAGETVINANENDQPTIDDFVWRLPPSLETSRNDAALRAQFKAVGESSRMTLKFRKPDQ
jgi:predicted methyltransferase